LATIYAIKGLILEEVLLNLLKEAGYSTVTKVNGDKTLAMGRSGIEVKGRGWNHQIDAIADFIMSPPFSYPIRLLLEAKFYSSKVGIDIIRNAVGVLKDVDEYWVSNNRDKISKPRFNYQYAVFTSSSFTNPAQRYAFAQDIYLIQLENNKYLLPLINSIKDLTYQDFNGTSNDSINIDLTEFRKKLRKSLKEENSMEFIRYIENKNFIPLKFNNLYDSSTSLSSSFLGMIGQRFPIFLTPSPNFNIESLIRNPIIRICWDEEYWYIVKNNANCNYLSENDILFSFDLPKELFELYADNNMLTQNRALSLKEEHMSSIQIVFRSQTQGMMSSINLKLDTNWINEIRTHTNTEER